MKIGKSFISMLAVSALLLGIAGCKQDRTPAEDAGKAIDQKVDEVGQGVEKAGQKMQN